MRASDLLFARSDGRNVLIGVNSPKFTMRFVGATAPASVSGNEKVTSFILQPTGDHDEELVAVSLWGPETDGKNPRYGDFPFFLKVTRDDQAGFSVDLKNAWLPSAGRIGQVVPGSSTNPYVRVRIGETFFASNTDEIGASYVDDTSLLLRYLIGRATPEDVNSAAVEHEEEVSACETLKRIMESCKAICNDPSDLPVTIAELISNHVRLQYMADIYYPLVEFLEKYGLFGSFGGVKQEYLAEDLDRRIGSVVALLRDIQWAYSDQGFLARLLLRRRLRTAYRAYKERAQETAHFAPGKL